MFISILSLDNSQNPEDVILGGVNQDEWGWPKITIRQGPFKIQ